MPVFVYVDEALEPVLDPLKERYTVVNYLEDPYCTDGEITIWVVKNKDDSSEWPMNGNSKLMMLEVRELSPESILHFAESMLKLYVYI